MRDCFVGFAILLLIGCHTCALDIKDLQDQECKKYTKVDGDEDFFRGYVLDDYSVREDNIYTTLMLKTDNPLLTLKTHICYTQDQVNVVVNELINQKALLNEATFVVGSSFVVLASGENCSYSINTDEIIVVNLIYNSTFIDIGELFENESKETKSIAFKLYAGMMIVENVELLHKADRVHLDLDLSRFKMSGVEISLGDFEKMASLTEEKRIKDFKSIVSENPLYSIAEHIRKKYEENGTFSIKTNTNIRIPMADLFGKINESDISDYRLKNFEDAKSCEVSVLVVLLYQLWSESERDIENTDIENYVNGIAEYCPKASEEEEIALMRDEDIVIEYKGLYDEVRKSIYCTYFDPIVKEVLFYQNNKKYDASTISKYVVKKSLVAFANYYKYVDSNKASTSDGTIKKLDELVEYFLEDYTTKYVTSNELSQYELIVDIEKSISDISGSVL